MNVGKVLPNGATVLAFTHTSKDGFRTVLALSGKPDPVHPFIIWTLDANSDNHGRYLNCFGGDYHVSLSTAYPAFSKRIALWADRAADKGKPVSRMYEKGATRV